MHADARAFHDGVPGTHPGLLHNVAVTRRNHALTLSVPGIELKPVVRLWARSSADSLACGLAGRDKSSPGCWKQFVRHGQAFYLPSGTLLSKLFTTRPSVLDCTVKMTAAFAF